MAQNARLRVGPVALTTTTTTNLLNPAAAGAGTGYTPTASYIELNHIRAVNKTNGAINVALWLGATGANLAGTEIVWGGVATAGALNAGTGVSVGANSFAEWFGRLVIKSTDFLVGGASAAGLTFEAEGETGLAGPVA
jgi:hypothetical protein